MKKNLYIKIDPTDIKALCEAATFSKGEALAKAQSVRNIQLIDNTKVSAIVEGSSSYQVQLTVTPQLSGHLSGRCTCPAADYQPFCKHMVALALSLDEESKPGVSDKDKIRRYLSGLDSEELLDKLLDYLAKDESAWDALLLQVKLSEQAPSYSTLKSYVTKAMPRKQLWDWRDTGPYFANAEHQLTSVINTLHLLKVNDQWRLIEYINARLNVVLEQIDDSSGDRFGIEGLINQTMPKVFQKLDWSEEKKAQWMFKRTAGYYEYDLFPSIEEDFVEVWQSNPHYLKLCRQALDSKDNSIDSWTLKQYANILIKMSNDWHEVAAIKQKIAHQCRDYLELATLYLEHNETLDTEYWLAKARKTASRNEIKQCDHLQVSLFLQQGEKHQAWKLSNKLFEQSPSFYQYQQLEALKNTHDIEDDTFLSRVEQALIDCYQAPNQTYVTPHNDSIVQFYIAQNEIPKACDWVDNHRTCHEILIALANHIIKALPHKALTYTIRVVSSLIDETNNHAYQEALTHLQTLESKLTGNEVMLAEFYRQIDHLAQTYKRKRNMLALLKKHYPTYLTV